MLDSPTPPDLENRHSPIIVGEHYELAETLALKHRGDHGGGLLAKPDYQAALLSMSGCDGKSIEDLNPDKLYLSGQYEGRSQASVNELFNRGGIDPHLHEPSGPDHQRASYDSAQSDLSELSVRPLPVVKLHNPQSGPSGTPLCIYISSDYDLLASPAPIVSLSFGDKLEVVDVIRLESTGSAFEFAISVNVPPFDQTGSRDYHVQLKLHMQDETGQHTGSVEFGQFEYTPGHHYSSPPATGKKRKMSEDAESGRSMSSYNGTPYQQNIDFNTANRRFTPFGRMQRYRDPYSVPAALPSQSMRPLSSNASAWSPNFTTYSGRASFPGETQTLSLTTSDNTPMLVRTTSLQQNGSPGAAPAGQSGFNPYMYPSKAVLKIHGDLNSMAEGWNNDEIMARRRLVQFTRSQQKTTINATFAPIAPEDRPPNSITVSCIWWEERQECFATSVDTISLLEQLVALRFTVEEKNRIRRNLEGFHPETVSKGKADSEEFFKIIMGFPNPKPRNIEKDVKVFPWKILGHALKKIISKYSASYSSTAGALGTPRSNSFFDPPSYGRSASDGAAQAVYGQRQGTMSPHGLPHHMTDTPLSSSLPSMSDYSLSTVPSPYTDSNYFPSPVSYTHHRTSSATEYEPPRPYKRARASTTNALSYTPHDAASLLSDMSRSLSDHGGTRLPSLSEHYGQVTPGMSRSSYDFGNYLDGTTQGDHHDIAATTGA